jgi:ribosome biogenesis GTPase / thiamine phosphate phosphatase
MDLELFGWSRSLEDDFASHAAAGLEPARVAVQHRGGYVVLTQGGERPAEASGRLHHEAAAGGLPVTGDWVAVRPEGDVALIEAVLPRRTAFVRKAAGDATVEQVLAANLDVAFLVASLPGINLRRLERFVTAAWESGAQPIVVLTKSDLALEPGDELPAVAAVAPRVPIHVVSSATGAGIDGLREHLLPNRTAALLGISGVGKSSLVNRLLGEERQAVAEVRDDGKGRHTTTQRELVFVPGGGLVLDTPGMREFALWDADAGLDETFDDVVELASRCRFRDCRHETEPKCAVRAAVEEGRLPAERLESYRKLERELAHLERRRDPRLQAEQRAEWRRIHRDHRRSSE